MEICLSMPSEKKKKKLEEKIVERQREKRGGERGVIYLSPSPLNPPNTLFLSFFLSLSPLAPCPYQYRYR